MIRDELYEEIKKIEELNEEIERRNEFIKKLIYRNGIIDGIRRYAWWKDGIQYVGTTGKTLEQAIKNVEDEYKGLAP